MAFFGGEEVPTDVSEDKDMKTLFQTKEPELIDLSGLAYIPDRIEVAEDKWLMTKLHHQLLDFITILTQLLDLMHLIRVRHLRSRDPLPHAVLREMLVMGNKGPLYKNYEHELMEKKISVSNSVDKVLKIEGYHPIKPPAKHRPKEGKKKSKNHDKFPYAKDMLEITGKKTSPLWYNILLEKHEELNIMQKAKNTRGQMEKKDSFETKMLSMCNKNVDIIRTKSETTLFRIKFFITELGNPLGVPDPVIERQMDMMLASDAGFKSVEEHQAYLKTVESCWFNVFLTDALKVGMVTCKRYVQAFERLSKYYDMNFNTLPYAKAKLSFVFMSLPLWDLARSETQKAIEFILENILLQAGKPLKDWLRLRGIRYCVLPSYNAKDFLVLNEPTADTEYIDEDPMRDHTSTDDSSN